jgi:hypothetical protein
MSNINPNNIDGTYPVAGQDNNSQGFRDNFTNTVNNFTFAAAELTDLQTNAVLKAALGSVGQTGIPTNNMNYTFLTKPQLLNAVETVNNLGTVSGTATIDWATASYQYMTLSANTTATINWTGLTSGLYARMRLLVTPSSVTTTLTLPSTVSIGLNGLANANVTTRTISFTTTRPRLYEFSTPDAGSTVAIVPLIQS